jgi:GNAT superfamily N-acetyltransferase
VIFVALCEAADRGELLLVDSGMCRFHQRRDGVVVVREIIVLPQHRRQGIGTALVERVRGRHPGARILAKCPAEYASNSFWAALGFVKSEASPVSGVNEWWFRP